MSKHTPGPWKWIPSDRGSMLVKGDESAVILLTQKRVENRNGNDTPDARLVAAAPEMLEALRSVLHFLNDYNLGDDYAADIAKVIKKAEGE